MMTHVVLFRPRPEVSRTDQEAFVAALEEVFRGVPTIRRVRVGRARLDDHGRDFPYAAILEFDDEAGLQAYFAHPLHQPVARLFHQTCAATLIVNAETVDGRAPLADFLLAGLDRRA
jgi:hypothetical protein